MAFRKGERVKGRSSNQTGSSKTIPRPATLTNYTLSE